MPPPPLPPPPAHEMPATAEAASPLSPFHAAARQSPPSAFSPLSFRTVSSRLAPRLAEDVSTVPEGYGREPSNLSPGAVAGVVLGSVAGFLLLLGLIYACATLGNAKKVTTDTGSVTTASVVTRKSRKHKHRHHSRSYSRSRSPRRETLEIRQERVERVVVPPAPAPPPMHETERIIVEERSRSRPPPTRMPRAPSPHPLSDDEDEVVVIEEHSPPRRRESRPKRRSKERRSNGYQGVDSYRYASGDEHLRDMSRRRSDSRRR